MRKDRGRGRCIAQEVLAVPDSAVLLCGVPESRLESTVSEEGILVSTGELAAVF